LIENTINNNLNKKFQITSENSVKIYLLLDSKPLKNNQTCYNIWFIAKKFKLNEYNKKRSILTYLKYKNYKDTRLRNFIKDLLKKLLLYSDIAFELSNY